MMKRLNEMQDILVYENGKEETNKDEVLEDVEYFKLYTIEFGDTLGSICEKFDLNYNENISKIIKINSITDINKIYAGQILYLPVGK